MSASDQQVDAQALSARPERKAKMSFRQQTYRPDIDGLRAIAVLSVAMFHFAVGPFRGGFAGVDIFFVISGYLITGIIHREAVHGKFTFAGFYERRVRRIFPALFAMLLAVMLAAPLILLPSDLERLGVSVIATLLFGSNILFWRQSGYFDSSSQYNPLLHTWSLSVEEQFYIGFPILLLLVERFARRHIVAALLLVASVSFILCLYYQPLRPSATFYLSPFRAWELILGALLAVGAVPPITNRAVREAVACVALLVLMASLMLLEEGPHFPGWIACFPALATAGLLHSGASGDSLVRRLLAVRPMVQVGLISYSLYLWHWPLAVFANYTNSMEPLPDGAGYGLLALSILAGWASYKWVEAPFRRGGPEGLLASRRSLFATALACMGALGLLAATTAWIDHIWKTRVPPTVEAMDRQRDPYIPYRQCDGTPVTSARADCLGGKTDGSRTILLWGDSHALAWAPALDLIGKSVGAKVIIAPNSACPPLFDVMNPIDPECMHGNDRVRDFIRSSHPDVVMLVGSWTSYSRPEGQYALEDKYGRKGNASVFAPSLRRTVEALRPHVSRIVLVGPTPNAPDDVPFRSAQALWTNTTMPRETSTAVAQQRSAQFWQAARELADGEQVHLVDPAQWFCDNVTCRYADASGALLYRDGGHLNVSGAKLLAKSLPKRVVVADEPTTPASN